MRMKRFSSALCLADKQRQQQVDKQTACCQECGQKLKTPDQQHKCQQQDGSSCGRQQQEERAKGRNKDEKKSRQKKPPSGFEAEEAGTTTKGSKSKLVAAVPKLVEPPTERAEGRQPAAGSSQVQQRCVAPDPMILARQRRPSVCNQASVNVDQQALFSAVECGQLERAKTLLENGKVDVNSLNGDKLTCLDIAVLLRNFEMVRLLQQHSAKESSAYLTYEGRANQLFQLYAEARRLVEDLSRSVHTMNVPQTTAPGDDQQQQQQQQQQSDSAGTVGPLMLATGSLLSSALFDEKQRQLQYWKRRLDLFMHMRYEFERLSLPSAPELVVLQVVGETSLGVKILHSLRASAGQPSAPTTPPAAFLQPEPIAAALAAAGAKENQQLASGRQPDHQQQQQPTCRDPNCSHWILMEERDSLACRRPAFDCSPCYKCDNPPPSLPSTRDGKSSSSGASNQMTKQQKLAVFDQLLAHQLEIISSQQRGLREQQQMDQLRAKQIRQAAVTSNLSKAAVANGHQQQQQQPPAQRQRIANLRMTTTAHNVSTDSAAANYWSQASSLLAGQPQSTCCSGGQQQASSSASPGAAILQPALACVVGSLAAVPKVDCSTRTPNQQPQTQVGSGQSNLGEQTAAFAPEAPPPQQSGQGGPTDGCQRHLAAAACQPEGGRLSRGDISDEPQQHSYHHHHYNQQYFLLHGQQQPQQSLATAITKYKVEWSLQEDMEPIIGSLIVYNNVQCPLECQIEGLQNGQLYYVRVSAGNHRGFSGSCATSPACLAPSSWRQVDGNKRRKYDEEVFRKFTKLILLNRHILDDHQSSSLLLNSGTGGGLLSVSRNLHQAAGAPTAAAAGTGGTGGSNNKSSLINMLLLDAIGPASGSELQPADSQRGQQNSLYESHEDPTGHHHAQYHQHHAQQQRQRQQQQQSGKAEQQPASSLSVRKNLKSFFQSNSFKFHKLTNQNKRGLYLCTVIYNLPPNETGGAHQEPPSLLVGTSTSSSAGKAGGSGAAASTRIVVTNDDRLPIIEVLNDPVAPGALMSDFYWLQKINGTQWMDIKRLRQQLQKSHSSSTLHLRIKLLGAIEQMQLALNIEDIGRIFYKPIQAHDGSIVICTCRQVASTKMVSNLSIKWTSQHKIIPRHLRKISDSMLVNQQQQTNLSAASGRRVGNELSLLAGATILPATTLATGSTYTQSKSSLQTGDLLQQSQQVSAGERARSDAFISNLSAEAAVHRQATGGGGGDFRLCEHCQYALVQRRSTMASGSSSSSLASSSDSQWSSVSLAAGGGGGGACACTCNHKLASGGANQLQPGPISQGRSASTAACGLVGSSSASTGPTGSGSGSSTARSGSMISGRAGQDHHHSSSMSAGPGGSARQSQAAQPFSAAQKSSTYLMLASLSLYDLLLFTMNEIIHFDRMSCVPLNRGLYLGFVQLQTTVESMRLLVPRARPNMVPCARIRDNAHVSREEWQLLKRFGSGSIQQQAAGGAGCTSSRTPRVSDPSIWSLESAGDSTTSVPAAAAAGRDHAVTSRLGADGDTDETAGAERLQASGPKPASSASLASLSASTGGFDRSRAKSVSPGLIEATGGPMPMSLRRSVATNPPQQQQLQLSVSSEQIVCPKGSASLTSAASNDQQQKRHQAAKSTGRQTGSSETAFHEAASAAGSSSGSSSRQRRCQTHSDTDLRASPVHPSRQQQRPEQGSFAADSNERRAAEYLQAQQQRSSTSSSASSSSSSSAAITTRRDAPPTTGEPDFEAAADEEPRGNRKLEREQQQQSAPTPTPPQPATQMLRSATATSRLTVNSCASLHQQSTPEETFVRLVGSAARRLLNQLKAELPKVYDERQDRMVSILQSLNDNDNNRIYHVELIELNAQVTFILLIPSAENVCPVTSHEKSNILGDNQDYMLLALQIFETIHIRTYEPELLGKYSRLSAILETDLIVAQHEHRQAFSSNELKSTKSRVSHLQDMVSIADEFWRQLRWIVDVVSFARDKSSAASSSSPGAAAAPTGSIRLGSIWRYFEQSPRTSVGELAHLPNLAAGQPTQAQPQPQPQPQPQRRVSNEVQRTTSARARDEQSALEMSLVSGRTDKLSVVDSVPEIHLTSHSSIASSASSCSSSESSKHGGQVTTVVATTACKSSLRHHQQRRQRSAKSQKQIGHSSRRSVRRHSGDGVCCSSASGKVRPAEYISTSRHCQPSQQVATGCSANIGSHDDETDTSRQQQQQLDSDLAIGERAATSTPMEGDGGAGRSLSKYCDESVYRALDLQSSKSRDKTTSCSSSDLCRNDEQTRRVQCRAIFSLRPSKDGPSREEIVRVEQIREDDPFSAPSSRPSQRHQQNTIAASTGEANEATEIYQTSSWETRSSEAAALLAAPGSQLTSRRRHNRQLDSSESIVDVFRLGPFDELARNQPNSAQAGPSISRPQRPTSQGLEQGLGEDHKDDVRGEIKLVLADQDDDELANAEEDAIYAYHISLRDATRAATERKSSQQSTRPILHGPSGSHPLEPSNLPASAPTSVSASASSSSSSANRAKIIMSAAAETASLSGGVEKPTKVTENSQTASSNRQDHELECFWALPAVAAPALDAATASASSGQAGRPQTAGACTKSNFAGKTKTNRALNTNNPFLTNSFDLSPN